MAVRILHKCAALSGFCRLAGLLLTAHVSFAAPASELYDETAALQHSQAAVGRQVSDFVLAGSDGQPITLGQFRGRPLVLSLIYTSCYHVCPMLTQHLDKVVDIGRQALGPQSFNVLAIGFDTAVDTPPRMRAYARERGLDNNGWFWASADEETMAALISELGFAYFPTPKGYDHLTQTTILDDAGRVYRQVYGGDFEPPLLIEPLKALILGSHEETGSLSTWLESIKLFCTIYDPASGRYRFDYSIFVSLLVGSLSLGGVAVFIFRAWRESKPSGPAW